MTKKVPRRAATVGASLRTIAPKASASLRRSTKKPSREDTAIDADPLARAYALLLQAEDDADDTVADQRELDTDLVMAAYFGDVSAAKGALDRGASANALQKRTEQSALMLAVANGKAKIVALLLERGADPNLGVSVKAGRTSKTVTPLDRAVHDGKTTIATLLRAHGAKRAEDQTKAPVQSRSRRAR